MRTKRRVISRIYKFVRHRNEASASIIYPRLNVGHFSFYSSIWAYLILNLKQVDEKDDRKVQRGRKEGSWRKRPTSALGSRGTTVSQPGSRRLSRACLSGNGEPGLGSRSWSKERPLATKVREEVWSQGLNVFASFSLVEEGFFLYTVYL